MSGTRRLSRKLSAALDAANKVISKITESSTSPEEDPDFLAKNPQWEDQLPPVHGIAQPTDGKTQKTAALLAALEELPPAGIDSPAKQNWKKAYKAVQRILIVRKKARQSAFGTGARLEGRALGLWGPYSSRRLNLFTLLHNQRAEYFILLMISAHMLVLILQVQAGSRKQRWTEVRHRELDFFDGFITSLYTVEMVLKIACLGFINGRYTYLRNPYNRLDLVIIVDSWVHIFVKAATGKDYFARIAVFRAFRGLLALKHIDFFGDVIAIMSAVKRSIGPLQNVILLTFFLLVFYALLGTQFLQNSLSQRCIRTTDNQLAYPRRYCDIKVADGYMCPAAQNQKCRMYGNPSYGRTSFDKIHYSLLTMFQIVSLEGWTVLMYRIKDAEGERANSYFTTLVIIGTYFLFNVFIAGISGVFLRVRAEHQALLVRTRSNQVSFYKATVMANVLKDDIIKDDAQMRWYWRFVNRTKQVSGNFARALSRTRTSVKAAFESGRFRLSRLSSRRLSRSLTMGVKAALTLSEHCRAVASHPNFNWGVLLTVTLNAIMICLYSHGMSRTLERVIYASEAVMIVIFAAELAVRFFAYGPGFFIDDRMNLLDVFVVAVSTGSLMSDGYPNITPVRTIRWFYLSKRHVEKHPSVVAKCIESVGSLVGVFFFYLLVIVVYSIISMELYGGQYYKFPEGYPRAHHDSMLLTMLLWFSVTTGESWPSQMFNSMRPGVLYNGWAAFLYVFYFVLTVHIIMNLIIAVILERNELTDNEKKHIQRVEHVRMIRRMRSRAFTRSGSWVVEAVESLRAGFGILSYRFSSLNVRPFRSKTRKGRHSQDKDRASQLPELPFQAASTAATTSSGVSGSKRRSGQPSHVLKTTGFPANTSERRGSRTALQDAVLTLADVSDPILPRRSFSKKKASFLLSDFADMEKNIHTIRRPWYLREGSLLLFGDKDSIRSACKKIVQSNWWWWFSIIWVTISTWLVIEMRPDGHFSTLKPLLEVLHKLVFVVFLVELLMKIISQGLIFSPDAVLGDPYTLVDVFLLVIDALDIPPWDETSSRIIHALIGLRPFRFVCRISGLRILLSNLIKTIPAIVSVLLFTFMIFVIFGSVGVQHFRGHLYFCSDGSIKSRAFCTGYYVNDLGILAPRTWSNPVFHFDDIGNAFLSLFVCSTFDNWLTNWLYPVMDIVGKDLQPKRETSPGNALYFVAFCCCGGFFIVRIFIGVFIDEFGKNSGSKLLTERQKLWRDMNRLIQRMEPSVLPRPPNNPIRKFCFHAIRNPYYHNIMIVGMLGYSLFLATNTAGQPSYISDRRQKAHCALTTFFILESLTKFLGDEFRVYKHEYSRHMEAVISALAAAGLMAKKGTVRGYIGRFAYISRVFFIIPHVPRARVIMRTLYICCPTMAEIMTLLAIFLFAFAGIGFQMFSQLKDGSCINATLNFRTFVNSFFTVFQVATLDNWSCIMADGMVRPPKCTNGSTMMQNDCGYPFASIIYFVVLVVVGSHIFMNLFVAVILDAITFGLVNENSMVTPQHLLAYKQKWSKKPFDPEATGYIGIHKLRSFVNSLGAPLGRRHKLRSRWYSRIEYEVLNFRVANRGVPFRELLETLTLYKIGATGLPLSLRIEREKRIQSIYRSGAATKIAAAARGFLVRRRAAKAKMEAEEDVKRQAEEKMKQESEPPLRVKTEPMLIVTD